VQHGELQSRSWKREPNVREIAGRAAHAPMNTIFTTVANTALRDE
jgi:hypothetical protein